MISKTNKTTTESNRCTPDSRCTEQLFEDATNLEKSGNGEKVAETKLKGEELNPDRPPPYLSHSNAFVARRHRPFNMVTVKDTAGGRACRERSNLEAMKKLTELRPTLTLLVKKQTIVNEHRSSQENRSKLERSPPVMGATKR